MKRGKKYVEAAKTVDRATLYDPEEAIALVKKTAVAKFDETIEAHIRTGCDGRHADQQIRGAVVLPNGTGKTVRVLVFAKNAKADEALAAGADYVGAEELIPRIQNDGWLDFDVVVATPDMMGVVGRLGRVLGPKGLMPNPKAGTVTMDVAKAIADAFISTWKLKMIATTTEKVMFRSSKKVDPSTNIKWIKAGTTVEVINIYQKWLKIKYDDKTGYIVKSKTTF